MSQDLLWWHQRGECSRFWITILPHLHEIHVGNQLRCITLLSHEWSIESRALRTSIHAILRLRLCQWQSWVGHHAINKTILIENDPLGDWSLEKNWCWRPTFRQPVRKAPSESRLSMVLLHPAFAPICWSLINPKSLSMCLFTGPRTLAANHLYIVFKHTIGCWFGLVKAPGLGKSLFFPPPNHVRVLLLPP